MSLSTNLISGLSSGFDWRTVIDQLIAVEHRSVDLVEDRKTDYENKLSAWQTFNTSLLALKTAAESLKDPDDFNLFTSSMTSDDSLVDADDLLTVTTSSSATSGSYTLKVTNLATAQKLSSYSFTGQTSELGSAYAGDILINGKVVTINATDSLVDLASTINGVNTGTNPSGVTASIVNYGVNDYRLILTSDTTGADGISLLNGSSTNLLQKYGWKDKQSAVVKNPITQGAQSDRFTTASVAIKSLLGLAAGEASTGTLSITANAVETAVTINLSTQSLTDIKNAINTAMAAVPRTDIVASVVSETVDGTTYYRLQIEGNNDVTFTDEKNILNTLGILHNNSAVIAAADSEVSANEMTSEGAYITADMLLVDIDGYISYDGADNIQMTGTKTGSGAVNYTFNISATTTVQDLLDAIETQYATAAGDAVAYVTADGKIQVDDVAGGGSLNVILADNITNGQLEFVDADAAFGDASAARKREITIGEDATVEIDGVAVTDDSNTIDTVIPGVTLNLVSEDVDTTVTLNVERDVDKIKGNIEDFADKYNTVISFISTQFSYDEESEETGGILFGDATLRSVKADLTTLITEDIWGVDSDFSILGLVGVEMNSDLELSIDDTILTGYLQTNFNDIKSLFVGQGTATHSSVRYVGHTRDSQAGEYDIHIKRAATRGTETGNVNLSGGGADETLTITQDNNTASVTITNGMSLDDIKNEINQELDTAYAETLVGDQLLTESAVAITAETKWANIDGTTLQNNDVISFDGTDRGGSDVTGSYTISNVSTDTVQGLLTAIENAYSSKVTASIDSSGRIVITDEYDGYSQLSIDITEPASRGLDFGTVDVTDGAGDGSQEGRYAMNITATDDGSNHLVLRNDNYGSASSFAISQDTTDNNYDHIIYTTTSNTTDTSSNTVYITSSTTWDDIYDAGIVNNDTITIAGTDRDGNALTPGSYSLTFSISDITTGTVNDLLTRIENVFGDGANTTSTTVDAFIRDGKIYVEDTTAGSSSISLTLTANNEGGGSLGLGTYDQTTERDLDLGLINGTVTGQDIAGTIDGESATGTGQLLRGDTDNINTDGLAISYTGTSDNTDVGTVKLTVGVAELFNRVLFNITDSIDGYVAYKQDALQDRIKSITDQIDTMEARLDRKMETMINRFVAMELALSQIQSQSDWLASQIGAAQSGWGS